MTDFQQNLSIWQKYLHFAAIMLYVQLFTFESVCLTLSKDSEWLQNYLAIEITFLPTESVRLTKRKYLVWLQNHLAPEITFLLTESVYLNLCIDLI